MVILVYLFLLLIPSTPNNSYCLQWVSAHYYEMIIIRADLNTHTQNQSPSNIHESFYSLYNVFSNRFSAWYFWFKCIESFIGKAIQKSKCIQVYIDIQCNAMQCNMFIVRSMVPGPHKHFFCKYSKKWWKTKPFRCTKMPSAEKRWNWSSSYKSQNEMNDIKYAKYSGNNWLNFKLELSSVAF